MLLQARGLAQARAQAAAGAATAGVVHPCAVGIRASFGLPVLSGNNNIHSCRQLPAEKSSVTRSQRFWHRCIASSSSTGSSSSPDAMDTRQASAAADAAQQRDSSPAWSVLNFYHLVDIAEPQEVCLGQRVCLQDCA